MVNLVVMGLFEKREETHRKLVKRFGFVRGHVVGMIVIVVLHNGVFRLVVFVGRSAHYLKKTLCRERCDLVTEISARGRK